jgi:cysteine desulfurase
MTGSIYLDNHATTCVDPRVVEAMLPYFTQQYGNTSSTIHAWGLAAHDALEASRRSIAGAIGAQPAEIVFTSGATESNNLVLRGLADRSRRSDARLVSVATEHRAILDPLERLRRRGFDVTLLPVKPQTSTEPGQLDLDQLEQSLREQTLLVSVMLANNEMGGIHSLPAIAKLCAGRGIPLHCDATQAVGKIPLNVDQLGVDLMSFSAHKLHGPKGIGALYLRRRSPPIRLSPLIDGGGQEKGLRSGTVNLPAVVGFAKALELSLQELPQEMKRLAELRHQLFQGLHETVGDCELNGPHWDREASPGQVRLPGNLNVCFHGVDGEAVMLRCPNLALSSGSACSSSRPEPSHVLKGLGLPEQAIRSSLRFGLARFNTAEQIPQIVEALSTAVSDLRQQGRSFRSTPS